MDLIERAIQIAADAHKEQRRKSDDTPYIAHPIMVMRILEQHNFDDIVVAAGVVHDVLEDTKMTEASLRAALNDAVVDIVIAVSEDKSLEWEVRKIAYIEAVSTAGEGVKAVSVADKIHNARSLLAGYAEQGSHIWDKFNRGKEQKLWFESALCDRLKQNWQHTLLDEYTELIEQMKKL